jgi:hypothetical protein
VSKEEVASIYWVLAFILVIGILIPFKMKRKPQRALKVLWLRRSYE